MVDIDASGGGLRAAAVPVAARARVLRRSRREEVGMFAFIPPSPQRETQSEFPHACTGVFWAQGKTFPCDSEFNLENFMNKLVSILCLLAVAVCLEATAFGQFSVTTFAQASASTGYQWFCEI